MAPRGKKNGRRKPRRFAKKRAPKSKKALTKLVRSVVRRQTETKTVQIYDAQNSVYPSNSAGYAASIIPLTPFAGYLAITQGTGQGQRIGNTIQLMQVKLSFVLTPNAYDVVTNATPTPIDVIMWMFYDKENPAALPVQGADFLQFGNTSAPLLNTLTDEMAPVNTDRYVLIKRRVFKVGYAVAGGTGINVARQSFANNDYKFAVKRSYNITKHCIKRVKFNDNNATPSTRGVYCIFQAVRPDGNTIAATQIPCNVGVIMTCSYKDA